LISLDSAEWDLPTIAPQWSVRDIAVHLLDTALGKLSMGRDKCSNDAGQFRNLWRHWTGTAWLRA
jgi:hypothetical protein